MYNQWNIYDPKYLKNILKTLSAEGTFQNLFNFVNCPNVDL